MTELATIQPTTVGVASIEETARALVSAHQIGTALCKTAFVPKHFQGKPDDAAAAILYGSTIDMDPVTALQNIYVIGGKPALYARTMVAIVLSKGHELWTEDEAEGSVTVAGRRKGSQQIERVTWTTEDAQRAGYMTNAKYKTDPRSMLYARASGDVARRIAPDALLGMAHNVEELSISEAVEQRPATTSAPAADRMRAALRPKVTAEQVVESEEVPEKPRLDTSSALAKAMFASMREAGIAKEQAHEFFSKVTGRDIQSSKELTEDEARQVLDHLPARPEATS
ncbi:hypothetical protein [Nocardioides alcanivorans]|uniref:hypothetical protein n=1 Tax=Nocardioides alcanivorans TaxID=2897352 RepID=UPI001F2B4CA2|nr:hypothetical protein [Nocardioides alcanivorans]